MDVPLPWWWHVCRPHCTGNLFESGGVTIVQRCACGACRMTDMFTGLSSGWTRRNERRISERKRAREKR